MSRKRITLERKEIRKRYVAIDPGVNGAIATLRDPIERLTVEPIPVLKAGSKGKKEIDLKAFYNHLQSVVTDDCYVLIESVHAMPQQGVSSTFKFGDAFGVIRALVWTLGKPHSFVTPQVWKRATGLIGKPKEASIKTAQETWPHVDFGRNKQIAGNCADAALMTLYARRKGL